MRPFRFQVHTGGGGLTEDLPGLARRAEELGYHALYITDHLGRQLAPIAALATAAAVTSRIRIGSYVFANDFRHPLILAREAATLDLLSGGRLDLGLGAGWMRSDYRRLGMPYDRPGLRIDRLEEALDIVVRLLSGGEVTHEGRFYRLEGARCGPLPAQRPHPPIMLGGGGPRMLRLAARRAQIVGLAPHMSIRGRPMLGTATDRAPDERIATIRAAAPDRFDDLELNVFVADAGVVGGDQPLGDTLQALLKSAAPAVVGGTPHVLYGTIGQLRDQLLRRRERTGVASYGIPARVMEPFAPLLGELAGR
jgi:probable F420-dependent oxidoreductase